MNQTERVLQRVNSATGLRLTPQELELIFSMQDEDQNRQYQEDLKLAVAIYEDAEQNEGKTTSEAAQKMDEVSKRIALWSYWAQLAKPVRSGLFRKRIPFSNKLTLKGLLSPDCEFVRSGKLD
tara:strand:+ start:97 stop:465 length:369 start_codon:yes stop_codon:yes gene_type:complete